MLRFCIIIITVLYLSATRRDVVITNPVGSSEEDEMSLAEKQRCLCGKGFLRSLHCRQNFMVTSVEG